MQRDTIATIASIYDTAGDCQRWNDALDRVVDFTAARAATIVVNEPDSDTPWYFSIASKIWRDADPQRVVAAIKLFRQYELPAWSFIASHPKQTLLRDTDFVEDWQGLIQREDYCYFRREFSLGRRIGACLTDNKHWSENLALQFDADLLQVPDSSMANTQLLLPHAAKSLEWWRTFRKLKQRYNAILGVLDHIAIGLCVVTEDGTVLIHNDEAARIFDESAALWLDKHQRIRCSEPRTQARLEQAINATAIHRQGARCHAETLFAVTDTVNRRPLLAEVTPLRDTDRELGDEFHGSMISLIDPNLPRAFKVNRIKQGYSLTDAEAQVCKYLVEGWTNHAIAEERGVQVDTIKSQIKNIFVKTATKRRSDLVRLCLKTDPPVN